MKWRKYIIKFAIMLVMTIIIMVIKNVTNQETFEDVLVVLVDAFTVPGIIFICFGLLILCANGGTFDMLVYGCQTALSVFKKDPRDRKYRTFREYREAKASNPKSFSSFIISGAIFLAIGIIFFIIYKCI